MDGARERSMRTRIEHIGSTGGICRKVMGKRYGERGIPGEHMVSIIQFYVGVSNILS